MSLEELQAEFTRLQAEQQQALEQERIWHENAVKLQGKLEYVQERAQALQIEQAQATVQQDAVSDVVENGHLDAEFGDPLPAEQVA